MKKLLLLTLVFSLPLAQMVRADNDKDRKKHKREAESAAVQRGQQSSPQAGQTVRHPARQTAQPQQRHVAPTQRTVNRAPHSVAPVNRPATRSEPSLNRPDRSDERVTDRGDNRGQNLEQTRSSNRNFDRNSFSVARSRVIRTPHNRNWWRSNFNTTFILFGGGYYYWWNGYWYPAYGYSPYYNNYIYSEPIYGYNNLAPGQVIENVQLALRDEGYYPGAIDGLVGPQTRAALAAFQRDHGLVVTEAVDEPTLVTLGLA